MSSSKKSSNFPKFIVEGVNRVFNKYKAKNCEICNDEFSLLKTLKKSHFCKRCERYVCVDCANQKAYIIDCPKDDNNKQREHRICNQCLYDKEIMEVYEYQIRQIKKDVLQLPGQEGSRTDYKVFNYSIKEFLYFCQFDHKIEDVRKNLFRVLKAFTVKNSEFGYSQGMNSMAAILLAFCDENTAFLLLDHLINNIYPKYFYQLPEFNSDGIGHGCLFYLWNEIFTQNSFIPMEQCILTYLDLYKDIINQNPMNPDLKEKMLKNTQLQDLRLGMSKFEISEYYRQLIVKKFYNNEYLKLRKDFNKQVVSIQLGRFLTISQERMQEISKFFEKYCRKNNSVAEKQEAFCFKNQILQIYDLIFENNIGLMEEKQIDFLEIKDIPQDLIDKVVNIFSTSQFNDLQNENTFNFDQFFTIFCFFIQDALNKKLMVFFKILQQISNLSLIQFEIFMEMAESLEKIQDLHINIKDSYKNKQRYQISNHQNDFSQFKKEIKFKYKNTEVDFSDLIVILGHPFLKEVYNNQKQISISKDSFDMKQSMIQIENDASTIYLLKDTSDELMMNQINHLKNEFNKKIQEEETKKKQKFLYSGNSIYLCPQGLNYGFLSSSIVNQAKPIIKSQKDPNKSQLSDTVVQQVFAQIQEKQDLSVTSEFEWEIYKLDFNLEGLKAYINQQQPTFDFQQNSGSNSILNLQQSQLSQHSQSPKQSSASLSSQQNIQQQSPVQLQKQQTLEVQKQLSSSQLLIQSFLSDSNVGQLDTYEESKLYAKSSIGTYNSDTNSLPIRYLQTLIKEQNFCPMLIQNGDRVLLRHKKSGSFLYCDNKMQRNQNKCLAYTIQDNDFDLVNCSFIINNENQSFYILNGQTVKLSNSVNGYYLSSQNEKPKINHSNLQQSKYLIQELYSNYEILGENKIQNNNSNIKFQIRLCKSMEIFHQMFIDSSIKPYEIPNQEDSKIVPEKQYFRIRHLKSGNLLSYCPAKENLYLLNHEKTKEKETLWSIHLKFIQKKNLFSFKKELVSQLQHLNQYQIQEELRKQQYKEIKTGDFVSFKTDKGCIMYANKELNKTKMAYSLNTPKQENLNKFVVPHTKPKYPLREEQIELEQNYKKAQQQEKQQEFQFRKEKYPQPEGHENPFQQQKSPNFYARHPALQSSQATINQEFEHPLQRQKYAQFPSNDRFYNQQIQQSQNQQNFQDFQNQQDFNNFQYFNNGPKYLPEEYVYPTRPFPPNHHFETGTRSTVPQQTYLQSSLPQNLRQPPIHGEIIYEGAQIDQRPQSPDRNLQQFQKIQSDINERIPQGPIHYNVIENEQKILNQRQNTRQILKDHGVPLENQYYQQQQEFNNNFDQPPYSSQARKHSFQYLTHEKPYFAQDSSIIQQKNYDILQPPLRPEFLERRKTDIRALPKYIPSIHDIHNYQHPIQPRQYINNIYYRDPRTGQILDRPLGHQQYNTLNDRNLNINLPYQQYQNPNQQDVFRSPQYERMHINQGEDQFSEEFQTQQQFFSKEQQQQNQQKNNQDLISTNKDFMKNYYPNQQIYRPEKLPNNFGETRSYFERIVPQQQNLYSTKQREVENSRYLLGNEEKAENKNNYPTNPEQINNQQQENRNQQSEIPQQIMSNHQRYRSQFEPMDFYGERANLMRPYTSGRMERELQQDEYNNIHNQVGNYHNLSRYPPYSLPQNSKSQQLLQRPLSAQPMKNLNLQNQYQKLQYPQNPQLLQQQQSMSSLQGKYYDEKPRNKYDNFDDKRRQNVCFGQGENYYKDEIQLRCPQKYL
ncbi:Zinc finger, FYVE/PHD-type [Pseudocohnilembus persalinus]|uniref:Zinc finger, FYVE/PHD-type n=1 Tax=Pseudocohnilembus persalinus TaxID=266149 RepID=A0A0V0QVE2_PSEPJ|nr:Zinc finger, FYVE/PHD-type [Pseudocohnilembus persalinus]|eukprot:KRX05968.1 Zinc finger, FYVE/PHD-type [Pseudocohnilembus persalinus]